MSYTVFARKYRPQKFADVLGQEHITQTLRNAIEQNRIAHSYIFVGPRGTGKTSTARIFAMALNCTGGPKADFDPNDEVCQEIAQGRSLDVIEIDGASNNGVEQVRELRENVRFAPARGKFKIYIIDEVHMLTTAAFNALLKTLEEPPPHAKFLMATTDVQKVLPTILSRCQRFDLRRIPTPTIAEHMLWIAKQEKFTLEPAAAHAVARGAEGGLRDAESMLDQLVSFCGDNIAESDVLNVFGFTAQRAISELSDAVLRCDASAALHAVHEHAEAGKDLGRLMSDFISHLRNLLVLKANPEGLANELSPEAIAALQEQSEIAPMEKLLDLIEQFAAAEGRMKWAPNKKMHFEVAVIRAIQTLQSATLTEVLDTLTALRGGTAPAIGPATVPSARPTPRASAQPPTTPVKKVPEAVTSAPKPAPVISTADKAPEVLPSVPEIKTPTPATPAVAAAPIAPVVDFWPAFIDAVRQQRKLISAWVESGVLLGVDADIARIGFPLDQSFAKDFLEGSHLALLEEIASKLLGRRVKIKLSLERGLAAPAPVPAPAPKDPMEEFKADPFIKKALEIFKAEIQPA